MREVIEKIILYALGGIAGVTVGILFLSLQMPYFEGDRKMGILMLAGGWYEEDCEWARVCCAFPELFPEKEREPAKRTLKNYSPALYETFYGVKLQEGESFARDEELARERNKNNYVTMAAWGDWHERVPKGMVGVFAGRGGRQADGQYPPDTKYFLVPSVEYDNRAPHGFVINTERHMECEPIK